MNAFLVDLTHGGVKISSELAKTKNYDEVYAYDLYNTLNAMDEGFLKTYNLRIIKDLNEFKEILKINTISKINEKQKNESNNHDQEKDLIINPIHSSLNLNELLNEISESEEVKALLEASESKDTNAPLKDNNIKNYYKIINHHKATALILKNWKNECKRQNINLIELTGVKGKTSTAFILNEIFQQNNKDTLILSSLGAHLFKNDNEHKNHKDIILQKNISITPANIINTVELARKIANPKCSTYPKCTSKTVEELKQENKMQEELNNNPYSKLNYDIGIFENSLGICGLGDIGILTNLAENYSIAKGSSDAREAKKQVFDAPLITIEYETLNEFYKEEYEENKEKINSFSISNSSANLRTSQIDYDIDKTEIKIIYENIKTISGENISGEMKIESFAPGQHHVLNILAAITTALALNIDKEIIQKGLLNFKGIDGRSSRRKVKNSRIIEEINPGINTKAIESSINMIKDIENYHILIGGKYGVTCEEIDEEKLSNYLNQYIRTNPNTKLILTDELGKSLKEKLEKLDKSNSRIDYFEDYKIAEEKAIEENKNILFIYRSNYSQVEKR
ncbi:coenzyme F430 synthase [uncultured Methanobrevibacter sp.]|uniref:coenzyme F430 synthase n=1 Tax=uncultured Methanobrevibacter sp. TaxID=253161 RepID=UPI0026147156